MAHKIVLLIVSLWVSSIEVSGNLPSLDLLNIPPPAPEKKTTTTPPPAPDPILTGAKARTATDRMAVELPDIVFGNSQAGGSGGIDPSAAANDINLDLDRLIKETLGDVGMGEPNAPRQTDFTALLDLINTDPINPTDPPKVPSFFDPPTSRSTTLNLINTDPINPTDPPMVPDFFKPSTPRSTPKSPKPTLPQLGNLVSTSNGESSVGIPASQQETARLSNRRNSQTVKIPDLNFPSLPPLPDLPQTSGSSPDVPPASSDLPSLTETSGDLPSLADNFGGLPSLGDLPPLPPQSSADLPSLPSLPSQTPGDLPPLSQNSMGLPSLTKTSGGLPSLTETSSGLPSLTESVGGLPSLTQTSGGLPSLTESSGGLPSLTETSGASLPPLSQTSGGLPSLTETSGRFPQFGENVDPFPTFPDTSDSLPSLPSLPDLPRNTPTGTRMPDRSRSLPDHAEPSGDSSNPMFNPDPRFQSQDPRFPSPFQPQGLPPSPFMPTNPRTSDLGETGRVRNPFATGPSQPPRRQGSPRSGRLPTRESLSSALSEVPMDSNDPSLLPFAENVLSQVQQLVNRLKNNGDSSPASERAQSRAPVPDSNCPNCPENPCDTSGCVNILNANCRPSCTDCSPRFYVMGRDVTDSCAIISGLRSSGGANVSPSESGAHLFIGSNGDFLNVPRPGRPAQTGNAPQMGLPQGRPPLIDPLTRQPIDPRFLEQIDPAGRVMAPRMEQFNEMRAQQQQQQQQQLPPGVAGQLTMDPRFLRALMENENRARMMNMPGGPPPFDPRIGQFMRPGAPPVSFRQMARLRGQNLDVDAVRRFMAEQGLSGTANVGGPEPSVPPRAAQNQALINQINALRRRGVPPAMIGQILQNGFRGAGPQQSPNRLPESQAGGTGPAPGVNAQQLQALHSQFSNFQTGGVPAAGNNLPQNPANQVPNFSIQSAQSNPLATIQAARRQLNREAVRRRANVI